MNYNNYYNNAAGNDDNIPYFEDSHDVNAGGFNQPQNGYNYRGGFNNQPQNGYAQPQNPYSQPQNQFQRETLYPAKDSMRENRGFDQNFEKKEPKNYQNLMMYEPRSEADSKTIIDFIKRKEPAIINLEKTDPAVSQRILDFVSGAAYALSGSVHRISGNIFLLSPKGVEVTVPFEV